MTAIIFDGYQLAKQREEQLKADFLSWSAERSSSQNSLTQPKIAAILFAEDEGSVLYSNLKKEAAERLGFIYELHTFSLTTASEKVVAKIKELNQEAGVTGIIIQKPRRLIWQAATLVAGETSAVRQAYQAWWSFLTSQIDPSKDVDGLNAISGIFPATAQAVVTAILAAARQLGWTGQTEQGQTGRLTPDLQTAQLKQALQNRKTVIIGRSDLLGQPLFKLLSELEVPVDLLGQAQLERRRQQNHFLLDADLLVSAIGKTGTISGDDCKEGVVAIDVGEPRPDFDFVSLAPKAAFITPVPGGIGPLTVVSLMENAFELVKK